MPVVARRKEVMTNTERVRAALRKRQDDMAKKEVAAEKPAPPPAKAKKPPKVVLPPKITHKVSGGGPMTIIQHQTGTIGDNLPDVKPKQKQVKLPAEGGSVSTPDPKPPRDPDKNRLPDRARFVTDYAAADKKWTATLTIPGCPVFTETRSGVFQCMHQLDKQYRRHLKAQAPTEGKKDDA